MNPWIIFLLAMFASVHSFGQDTVSVYFNSGQAKIPKNHYSLLDAIPVIYDLSTLDSVRYIGMADSIGPVKSNRKLSERRAENVAKYCENFFPERVTIKIFSLGERAHPDRDQNRRVDMLLYFRPPPIPPDPADEKQAVEAVCYNIDYQLLHRSHEGILKKRQKEWVLLTTTLPDLKRKDEHYYGTINESGEFKAQRVKWKSRRTGQLWWSKNRYEARIPKKDYHRYKIFKISPLPCDSCAEDIISKAEDPKGTTCHQVDRFLMDNIQIKTGLFNKKSVQVRAPREYIHINDRYILGCELKKTLIWNTRKGKRKQLYYYSELPLIGTKVTNITRMMDCCEADPEPSECEKTRIQCATLGNPSGPWTLNAEVGSELWAKDWAAYAGLGVFKEGLYARSSFLLGMDTDLSLITIIRYQLHLLSIPYDIFKLNSGWQSPSDKSIIYKYARLYLGSELGGRFNADKNFVEQNLHVGIASVDTNPNAFIPRIFVQYGLGVDYLSNRNDGIYSVAQLGLVFRLAQIGQ